MHGPLYALGFGELADVMEFRMDPEGINAACDRCVPRTTAATQSLGSGARSHTRRLSASQLPDTGAPDHGRTDIGQSSDHPV